ncbi:hypothetical protein DMP23_35725 [Amycolatopsis sp. A1MSW2902]
MNHPPQGPYPQQGPYPPRGPQQGPPPGQFQRLGDAGLLQGEAGHDVAGNAGTAGPVGRQLDHRADRAE